MSTDSLNLDQSILQHLLYQMYLIRCFEETLFRAFQTEKMPGTMHQTTGQEAIAAGVGEALEPGDVMTSTHRGHGHAIAKGLAIRELMAEMYARQTGTSHGMGGSMHLFDLSKGFLGTTGVVGAGVPIAVGAALVLQLEGEHRVAVAFLGDGAANQGAVHEAINLASVWKLPVVFVCENNGYAVSLPTQKAYAIKDIAERAAGYGISGVTVDGNDVLAVYEVVCVAVARARAGDGPSFLECLTYRHKGHSRFEPASYRPAGELDAWLKKDPIKAFCQRLISAGIFENTRIDAIKAEAQEVVDDAVDFARSSPLASLEEALHLAFADREDR
ncbi:MAG TPA: thiamine pyrophosphate-dependent dehydrogenase E1 component subunit alpha [Anaerolineaceae bacterium]|nr:thiamine pyrophosphate-dependent dehydrogenase E1 component subunit alpha [Anaerolineaceae bacterium]